MFVEANITIDVPDGVDVTQVIEQIRSLLTGINGEDTNVNVVEVDDPVSTNPIYLSKS